MFLSPLTSRLKTNYVPTDDELFELRGWYAAPKAKIGKLDAEIERAQTELNALITQRDELQQMVLDYRALESPLRRFPVDLLREIFFHCLPKSNNAIMIAQEAPLVLTHICSSWRSVALSTPTLWASFHLPVPPHNVATTSNFFFRTNSELDSFQAAATESMQKRRRGVEVFLSRSAKCSLDISLHDMEQSPVVPNKYCDIFLDMIIPLSHRWRSMSFTTSEHHLERIAALTNNDVPELEKLVINQTSHQPELNEGDPVTSWFGSTFFNASRLRDVSLTNIDHVDMLPFRWPDLTHISMTRLPRGFGTVSNICTLLRKCRRLVSARLMISADELPWALNVIPGAGPGTGLPLSKSVLSNTPIVLPDLVNLSLISNGKNLSDFFPMLEFPQLRKLEYHTDVTPQPTSNFILFLERVGQTLTSLTVDAQLFTRSDFCAALKAAHRLKSFTSRGNNPWGTPNMRSNHFDDIFLGMLVGKRLGTRLQTPNDLEGQVEPEPRDWEDYSEVLLPELEELDCQLYVDFTDDGLLEFLKLRQRPTLVPHIPLNENTSAPIIPTANETAFDLDNISRLKRLFITFSRDSTRPMAEEIEFLKAGLELSLEYMPQSVHLPFTASYGILPNVTDNYVLYPY